MERRKFSREFMLEAVKLARVRGYRWRKPPDLDVHTNVLRHWARGY